MFKVQKIERNKGWIIDKERRDQGLKRNHLRDYMKKTLILVFRTKIYL